MSRNERERLTILTGVQGQQMTLVQAAELMGLGYQRLLLTTERSDRGHPTRWAG